MQIEASSGCKWKRIRARLSSRGSLSEAKKLKDEIRNHQKCRDKILTISVHIMQTVN